MDRPRRFAAVSVGLALAAAVFLLVWPVYTGYDAGHRTVATLLQVNGGWAVVPVAFPVGVALMAAVFGKRAIRIFAAFVMCAFAFIAMSIGLFYVPAAILMVLAACVPDSCRPGDVTLNPGETGR